MASKPEFFWVIGGASDVGKTTVACALLRELNERGYRTAPFKPTAAANLFTSIDWMCSRPRGNFSGSDASRMVESSSVFTPAQRDGIADVVSPVRMLFFHTVVEMLLVRAGSAYLGTERFVRTVGKINAFEREDVQSFLGQNGILEKLPKEPVPGIKLSNVHRHFNEERQAAFQCLLEMSPGAMVLEGASNYLPLWPGAPQPDHMLFVRNGFLDLFSGIHPGVMELLKQETPPRATDLERFGRGVAQKGFRVPLPISTSGKRDRSTAEAVSTLLDKAGLHAPGP